MKSLPTGPVRHRHGRSARRLDEKTRNETVKVFDCDLEGSTGIAAIRKAFPDIYVLGGIMERGNYSAAAGFGMEAGKQGVFATFSAFLEMCVSEITMARLNNANVLAHFSHSGCDDMADNTCHYGINHLFADGGVQEMDKNTRLYFPSDPRSCRVREAGLPRPGLRFVFSNKIPFILKKTAWFWATTTIVTAKTTSFARGMAAATSCPLVPASTAPLLPQRN